MVLASSWTLMACEKFLLHVPLSHLFSAFPSRKDCTVWYHEPKYSLQSCFCQVFWSQQQKSKQQWYQSWEQTYCHDKHGRVRLRPLELARRLGGSLKLQLEKPCDALSRANGSGRSNCPSTSSRLLFNDISFWNTCGCCIFTCLFCNCKLPRCTSSNLFVLLVLFNSHYKVQ